MEKQDEVEFHYRQIGWGMAVVGGLIIAAALWTAFADGFSGGLLGTDMAVLLGAALVGVVIWVTLVRPRIGIGREELVLQNMLSTWTLPLAAIETFAFRQYLVVRVGDRSYSCAGVGRSRRDLVRPKDGHDDPTRNMSAFLEARLSAAISDARAQAGDADQPPVRRTWAIPELLALVLLTVLFGLVVAL